MMVDDEADIQNVLKKGLEHRGFIVDIFCTPSDAISNFKRGAYDMLILDLKMPDMNGFELYSRLRKIDDSVKVCFMTAFERSYVQQISKGIISDISKYCFIRKPISISDFAEIINLELLRG